MPKSPHPRRDCGEAGNQTEGESMKVLIACEESQTVCKAFRARGHEAYSCDIQEPSGGHPEWHILGDAIRAMQGGTVTTMDGIEHDIGRWDLLIAHPPLHLFEQRRRLPPVSPKGRTGRGAICKGAGSKGIFHALLQCGHPANRRGKSRVE